jgi:hypothetical protein
MRIALVVPMIWLIGPAQQGASLVEEYRKLEFPKNPHGRQLGWENRVALESRIIRTADLASLRVALNEENPFVRSMAARALGILGDKTSVQTLSSLVRNDHESSVRAAAVEALGWLKSGTDAIEEAKEDKHGGVRIQADYAAGRVGKATDYAAKIREGYSALLTREEIGSAKIGGAAPPFTALTSDGEVFKLSDVLGKKSILLYFAITDD